MEAVRGMVRIFSGIAPCHIVPISSQPTKSGSTTTTTTTIYLSIPIWEVSKIVN